MLGTGLSFMQRRTTNRSRGVVASFNLDNMANIIRGTGPIENGRATVATVVQFDNNVTEVKANEIRIDGARRVANLAPESDVTLWLTTGTGVTVTLNVDGSYRVTLPSGSGIHTRSTKKFVLDTKVRLSLNLKYVSGGSIKVTIQDSVGFTVGTTIANIQNILTTEWKRLASNTGTVIGSDKATGLWIRNEDSAEYVFDIEQVVIEDVTGQVNKNPSTWLDPDVQYNAGIIGVRYFDIENNNTVSSFVVTELIGPTISPKPLMLHEGEGTNLAVAARDFTDVAWATVGLTVTADSLVDPQGLSGADTLASSVTNGTVIQSTTEIIEDYIFSIYLKRKTGTGNIAITIDNGVSWTTVVLDTSWQRFSVTQNLANPSIGVRIATSGDEVYAWHAQLEIGLDTTTPIPETIIRDIDDIKVPSAGNIKDSEGMVIVKWVPGHNAIGGASRGIIDSRISASHTLIYLHASGLHISSSFSNVSSVLATITKGDSVFAAVIWSDAIGDFIIGRSLDNGVTWLWGAVNPIVALVSDTELRYFFENNLSHKQQETWVYKSIPGGTLNSGQSWIEDNII